MSISIPCVKPSPEVYWLAEVATQCHVAKLLVHLLPCVILGHAQDSVLQIRLSKMHAAQNWLRDSKYYLLSKTAVLGCIFRLILTILNLETLKYLLLRCNAGPDLSRVNIPKKR